MIRSPATLRAPTLPLSRYSTMSGAIRVESMRTRIGVSVSLRIWCAPSLPRGKATTSPSRSCRSPSCVRSVGSPRRTITHSSFAWCVWNGPCLSPGSTSYMLAPMSSASICAPTQASLIRQPSRSSVRSHSGSLLRLKTFMPQAYGEGRVIDHEEALTWTSPALPHGNRSESRSPRVTDRTLAQAKVCPGAVDMKGAHLELRSVAHRWVGHELADLLSTAAGGGDLRGPLQGCLPRGHVEDGEPSVELLGLRVSTSGDRPVAGHHDGIHVFGQPAAEHPHACVHGLLDHRMSSLSHGGELLLGDVVNRAAGERNQVPRHLTTPFSAACSGRISASPVGGRDGQATEDSPLPRPARVHFVRGLPETLARATRRCPPLLLDARI